MTASKHRAPGPPEDPDSDGTAQRTTPSRPPAPLPTAGQLRTLFTVQLSHQLRAVPPPRERHG